MTTDKALVEEFLEWYSNTGVAESTVETARRHLELFVMWLGRRGKSLEAFDHRDVVRFASWMRSVGYSEFTVRGAVKKFLRYMCEFVGREEMCEVYARVKLPRTRQRPPEVLDPRVIREFIYKVPDLYWKTLFAVLYETGARVSEVVRLRIGDLAVDEYGFKVTIRRSKSEERTVRVIEYAPLLREYLDELHPFPDDPEAWLFPQKRNLKKHVTRQEVWNVMSYYAKQLGFEKYGLHPHLFRHVRAYELLQRGLSEKYLLTIFGWRTREMIDVYAKLLPSDVDQKLIELVYRQQPKKKIGRRCPSCGAGAPADARYCPNCSALLEVREAFTKAASIDQTVMQLFEKFNKIKQILQARGLL